MKLTQEQKILAFLHSRKCYVPIFDVIDFGLRNYIVNASRILPKMATINYVDSRTVDNKKYKEWKISKEGIKYLKNLK